MKAIGVTQIYYRALQFYGISNNTTNNITVSAKSYKEVRLLDLLRINMLSYRGEKNEGTGKRMF